MCFLGLAVLCALPPGACATGLRLTSAEKAVIKLINKTRAEHGLQALHVRACLCKAARSHSREMVRRKFFSHLSRSGESQAARVLRFGYSRKGCRSWSTGEAIAYGTGLASTPQAIVKQWLGSAAHRALLLSARWRDIGVGRAAGTFRGVSGAAVFTVDLGRRTY